MSMILCGECKMWQRGFRRDIEGRHYGTCELDGKNHYRTHICETLDASEDSLIDRVLLYDRAGMIPGQIAQRLAMPVTEIREMLNYYKTND